MDDTHEINKLKRNSAQESFEDIMRDIAPYVPKVEKHTIRRHIWHHGDSRLVPRANRKAPTGPINGVSPV